MLRRILCAALLTAFPSLGTDRAKLDALRDALAARRTQTFLVVEGDRIVCEWYAPTTGPSKPHYTASMAKALVGGMSLLVARGDGKALHLVFSGRGPNNAFCVRRLTLE